jgi:hypothetical protein
MERDSMTGIENSLNYSDDWPGMKNAVQNIIVALILCALHIIGVSAQESPGYYKIRVVDQQTGRGVPLVELKTTNNIRYYTDNNGIIAFHEPGLMDQEVYFHINSHGYEYPRDGFGYRGRSLMTTKGDSVTLKIKRTNIAERLYRVTGQGLYHHSLLVGEAVPLNNPVLNGKVAGQDGGIAIPYNNKLYWFWGDTNRPSYPLGNFACAGATSELPDNGGLDPALGIELNYFVDETGFTKHMFPADEFPGPGPKWPSCLMTFRDPEGKERLIAQYTRVKDLDSTYERGLAIFNDTTDSFEKLVQFDMDAPVLPNGNAFKVTVNGDEYYYFSYLYDHSVLIRVKASLDEIQDPDNYESFTCLKPGSRYNDSLSSTERNSDGTIQYSWKANTSPVGPGREKEMISAGLMKAGEAWFQLQDIHTGEPIVPHSGSIQWNSFLRRWVMIVQQNMGEVWFASGDTPLGPWTYAQKIVTHDNYNFYLPVQHPYFDQDGGRHIYFEGTYTNAFSGNPDRTPRYNYNQIMYRLDLNDPALYLPEPVYALNDEEGNLSWSMRDAIDSLDQWENIRELPFYAYPNHRKPDRSIPVYLVQAERDMRLRAGSGNKGKEAGDIIFYALPSSIADEDWIVTNWECTVADYPVNMEIQFAGDRVRVSFEEKGLSATHIEFYNDTIEIYLIDSFDAAEYVITASIADGKLNGTVVQTGEEGVSTILGERVSREEKSQLTPVMVPLYEYQNRSGAYYYSTRPDLPDLKRAEDPVCIVWRNPSTTLVLDHEAKPPPSGK